MVLELDWAWHWIQFELKSNDFFCLKYIYTLLCKSHLEYNYCDGSFKSLLCYLSTLALKLFFSRLKVIWSSAENVTFTSLVA